MGRPKKVEEMKMVPPLEEKEIIVEGTLRLNKHYISKLEVSFGREDLNAIAHKINELIDAYNAK
jgi:hypothetical protein